MYLRRNSAIKCCIAFLFGAVLYSEKLVYLMQTLYWQDLNCLSHDQTCTKILFIADPQIQGVEAAPWPWNEIFIWDSDRYLKMTFSAVFNYFKPDILVFLGDLMDEGSTSTKAQFSEYVQRLTDIFVVNCPVSKRIWIPGDNDIGGEGESIHWDKLKSFLDEFDEHSVVQYRNITFYKVNAITQQLTNVPDGIKSDNSLKIVISHYPLTRYRTSFMRKVNSNIHPDIYFCGHDHESKYVIQNEHSEQNYFHPAPFYENRILEIPFGAEDRYEVYVPTCSYRMGTKKIGYGAAVLDNNNQQMRYTVLWSPERFPHLFFYLGILSLLIVCCVFKILCIYWQKCNTQEHKRHRSTLLPRPKIKRLG